VGWVHTRIVGAHGLASRMALLMASRMALLMMASLTRAARSRPRPRWWRSGNGDAEALQCAIVHNLGADHCVMLVPPQPLLPLAAHR